VNFCNRYQQHQSVKPRLPWLLAHPAFLLHPAPSWNLYHWSKVHYMDLILVSCRGPLWVWFWTVVKRARKEVWPTFCMLRCFLPATLCAHPHDSARYVFKARQGFCKASLFHFCRGARVKLCSKPCLTGWPWASLGALLPSCLNYPNALGQTSFQQSTPCVFFLWRSRYINRINRV